MRRYVAIGAAAVALSYFLDPENGRRRRRAVRAWLTDGGRRAPDTVSAPEDRPTEPIGNGRPAVREPPPPPVESVEQPVTVAAAEAQEAPRAVPTVAVAEPSTAEPPTVEAVLPPPLPKDVLEAAAEPPAAEDGPEPAATPSRRGRAWLVGGAALLAAVLAAAVAAAFVFDVVELADDEPSSSPAAALAALTDRQARAISIMAQPGATRLPVVGAEERLLLIVGMEGDAVLLVSRLERAPAGKTYEIWVISGKTPQPAGLFQGGRDTVVPLTRPVPKGATVALTLERLGGAPRPSSDPIYAVVRS
jgi:Anti-sigma-K factor rskA